MSRLRFFTAPSSILMSFLVGAALGAVPACGGDDDDDDGDDDGTPDAAGTPDADVPDAAVETSRTGVVAVTETEVTNSLVLLGPPPPFLSGAVVSISFVDDQSVTVPPLPDFDSNLNGCAITVYDDAGGDLEPEVTDEGVVSVTGTANGDFACGFVGALGDYLCQSPDADLGGGVVGNAVDGDLAANGIFTLLDANFGPEMAGTHIQLDGFGDGDGVYAIAAVMDAETLIFAEQVTIASTGGADATYTTFIGEGPLPNIATNEFLDDGTETVTISKEDSAVVPGFTMTASARGEGFELTVDSNLPDAFPDTADDVVFACDGAGCGSDPAENTDHLTALVVNGTTTDVLPDIGDDDGFTMLPAVTAHATFTCSMVGADEITIPLEGVQAILDTLPARIQITIGRFAADLPPSGASSTTVVLGHSLTGFTTFEPK
jgi:hypothetical protein